MKKFLKVSAITLAGLYILVCLIFYFGQNKLLFHPTVYNADHVLASNRDYEELNIRMTDGTMLNGILIKSDSSRGVVFYLHGNGGSIYDYSRHKQGDTYLEAGYDFFLLDYRGYGKSSGVIESEQQLLADMQASFDVIADRYHKKEIIILGYSLGSGIATKLAAQNSVDLLILLAPYYSMVHLKNTYYPFIPTFLVKYKLRTFEAYPNVKSPIVMFHGADDTLIPIENSKMLSGLNVSDTLIVLPGQAHNGIPQHELYQSTVLSILDVNPL